jgi:hypothetical protein
MWLTGRLVPDHKTIADFRKDDGGAIRKVCARFIMLCRAVGLFTAATAHHSANSRKPELDRGVWERTVRPPDDPAPLAVRGPRVTTILIGGTDCGRRKQV